MRKCWRILCLVVGLCNSGSASAAMWSYSEGRNQDLGFDEARLAIASEDNRYELSVSCMNNVEQNVTIILHTPERSDGVEGLGQGESFALSIDGHEAQELQLRSFNGDRFRMYGNMFRYEEAQYQ